MRLDKYAKPLRYAGGYIINSRGNVSSFYQSQQSVFVFALFHQRVQVALRILQQLRGACELDLKEYIS